MYWVRSRISTSLPIKKKQKPYLISVWALCTSTLPPFVPLFSSRRICFQMLNLFFPESPTWCWDHCHQIQFRWTQDLMFTLYKFGSPGEIANVLFQIVKGTVKWSKIVQIEIGQQISSSLVT